MFTDRFIKLPIDLFDTDTANQIGYNDNTKTAEVMVRVSPLDISYYRPAFDKGEPLNETFICLKTGIDFNAKMKIDEFEKVLNEHQKSI